MKKFNLLIAGAAVLAMTASCSEEQLQSTGEGTLDIRASVSDKMTVVSRAMDDIAPESYQLWISNEKGLVRRYDGQENFPSAPVALIAGNYVAEVWAGDSVSASFDKRWFKGRKEFTISNQQSTSVEITGKIANVGVTVKYADNIGDVIEDYTFTVSHDRGELVFEADEARTGFFMMPSTDKNLHYVLAGTRKDGAPFKMEGDILDAAPATNYVMNVQYSVTESNYGGAIITIRVDETTMDFEDKVSIVAPPAIIGYGFDIKSPLMGEMGAIGEQSLNILTSESFASVILESTLFNQAFGNKNDADVLTSEQARVALEQIGVTVRDLSADYKEGEGARMQIIFSESFMNSLTEGEHAIKITATDTATPQAQTASATLTVVVSNAPVMTEEAAAVDYKTATLCATKVKDADSYGFNWREVGEPEWKSVEAAVNGNSITANIEGLTMGHTYEYVATTPDFVSAIVKTFTTNSVQLPNCGFEDWSMSGAIQRISADPDNFWWDSGNTAASMIKNITTPEQSIKHSGQYSAKLSSTSLFGVMAAGNLFVGKFIARDGTNGILGWGRPFTETPKAVKLWAKYVPGNLKKGDTSLGVSKGDPDTGIIYIALVDNTTQSSNGESWPCIVKTKAAERQLFDKNGENVIAYGEHIFETATPGNDLIEITIPVEYFKNGVTPANIIFVASASRYGDYFICGESIMYLDDIELIY